MLFILLHRLGKEWGGDGGTPPFGLIRAYSRTKLFITLRLKLLGYIRRLGFRLGSFRTPLRIKETLQALLALRPGQENNADGRLSLQQQKQIVEVVGDIDRDIFPAQEFVGLKPPFTHHERSIRLDNDWVQQPYLNDAVRLWPPWRRTTVASFQLLYPSPDSLFLIFTPGDISHPHLHFLV